METKRTESRLGRFAALLKGRARPRRSLALMMALVIVAVMSFAGVVSADAAYTGQPPMTNFTGVVNGSIDVQFGNTWKSDNPIQWDNTTANLTLAVDPSNVEIKFAVLKVVVYTANNTANWQGNETIKLDHGGTVETLANYEPLNLNYVNSSSGMVCNTSISAPPFISQRNGLCRVMSDYVSYFDVKDYITTKRINVSVLTGNVTDRFDGRVKEATLIYGWNVTSGTPTKTRYWINIGHDPSTSFDDAYVGHSRFDGIPDYRYVMNATLYTNDISSSNGLYGWNGVSLTPTTIASNSYARINRFFINNSTVSGDNDFRYDRSGTYYRIATVILKLIY
ncbi:DUF3344 domain-containing protein [Methanoregula formicica]|uniref:DUF3344 domain-containing protein n=1 Tax=Methanoregula formicica (strain DSM 22288 / NBRC 105244 / SMSP) TaxID=593750 RepID=L0HFL4_METFS|nr:DUF3344 domain-containing protein [Methanoregula formicica]AGB01874.1 Protein of unknown function (DUF3344) [Methanoregula formicica SMSP]